MLADFTAQGDIRGGQIRLDWTWVGPGDRPALRLRRRRQAFPLGPDDGELVLDLSDLFQAPAQPWAAIRRARYLAANAPGDGELALAETWAYFSDAAPAQPVRMVVRVYDTAAGSTVQAAVEEVSRVEITLAAPEPPWAAVETFDIFVTPGGGPEQPAGQIVVSTGHEDGVTLDQFSWTPEGGAPIGVAFDRADSRDVEATVTANTAEAFSVRFQPALAGQGPPPIALDEGFDPDTGDWRRHATVFDPDVEPGVPAYYALFGPDPAVPGSFRLEPGGRAWAMATDHYGLDDWLYRLLPAIHRRYDEPLPGQPGKGELRRFLSVFGLALDQVRGTVESLRTRHDVDNVRADLLPYLAHWIGWEPDQTLDELAQRNDIRFAPQVYRTVGTAPNVEALVTRVTGWQCRIKEFVHNVMLTNAPESIRQWEIWERVNDGAQWGAPDRVTTTEGLDGAPAATMVTGDKLWLAWHGDRDGRREIWLQRLDSNSPPRKAVQGTSDDLPGLAYTDEHPALVATANRMRLFWTSNRTGDWQIWTREYVVQLNGVALQPRPAEALTDHPADDRSPAAVVDNAGQTWLFWQSNRRGPTDIWSRVFDGTAWSLPARLTTALLRDEAPAAVVDGAGRIWMFWSADEGDRSTLWVRIHDAGGWGPAQSLPELLALGAHRDESPAAVLFNGQVWLFWDSNRGGRWQVWSRTHDGAAWSDPVPVADHPAGDKEPGAVIQGATLRLFWRSQRGGVQTTSRTIDTKDAALLDRLRTFDDRSHYTYDAGAKNRDWYARGTVGLYLAPDTADPVPVAHRVERVRAFIEPFRPVPVRFVWLAESPVDGTLIDIDPLIEQD